MYINITTQGSKLLITELNEDYKLSYKTVKNFKPELFAECNDDTEWKTLIDNKSVQRIVFDNIYEYRQYTKQYRSTDYKGLHNIVDPEYQYIRQEYSEQEKFSPRYWYLDIETGIPADGSFPSPFEVKAPITVIQIAESDTKQKYIFAWLKVLNYKKDDMTYLFCESESDMLEKFTQFIHYRTPAITVAWNGDGFDYPYIVNRMEYLGLNPEMLSPFNELEEHRTVIFGKQSTIRKPKGIIWLDYIDCYKKGDPSGKESWSLDYMSKYVLGDDCTGKVDYSEHGFDDMKQFIKMQYNPDNDNIGKLKAVYNIPSFEQTWWDLFIDYSETDVDLLMDMDNALGLLDMIVALSHTMGSNIYDVFGTIKPWTNKIYNELYKDKITIPAKTPFETYHTIGGHVYANPGIYEWVASDDYTSLYPFCLICLNLSPETQVPLHNVPLELVELTKPFYRYINESDDNKEYMEDIYLSFSLEDKLKIKELLIKYNLVLAPNGTFWTKEKQGYLPYMTQSIYNGRKADKKQMKIHENEVERLKKENLDYAEHLKLAKINDVNQYVKKILINSLYGYTSAKTAPIANSDLSNAITSYGRLNIKRTTDYVIDKVKEKYGFELELVQLDTDSHYLCFDDLVKKSGVTDKANIVEMLDQFLKNIIQPLIDESSAEISGWFNAFENSLQMDRECIPYSGEVEMIFGKCKIGELVDSLLNKEISNDYLIKCFNDKANEIEYKKVTNVMKHKTTEKLLTISNGDYTFQCTENHKVAIRQNNEIIYKEAKLIISQDELISISQKNRNGFNIIKQEDISEYVYDIEVEDNHNFFVNDILVHNCIADVFISTGKKRYACRIYDNEGVRLVKPKKKIVGLDVKRSDVPEIIKEKLTQSLDCMFEIDNQKLIQHIEDTKNEYMKLPLEKIAIPTGITDIDKWADVVKGRPQHVKGAINHNEIITKLNKQNDYPLIVNGDKIKLVMLKTPNRFDIKVLAFQDWRLLDELDIKSSIDYEFMFERSFMSPINTLTEAINWKTKDIVEISELF